ncbi:MAG TPA: c-type cytochrome [Gammaproteobacteria bacterium]|nr:c-type cytochrome [Gammaproteobacteria bacterium]
MTVSALVCFIAARAPAQQLAEQAKAPAAPPAPLMPITLTGDAGRGVVLATTCGGCHGVPDSHNAYPAYHVPKLGGQNADYIEVALQGYRRGTRSHPTMQVQAATLSDQDIADIAAYFSTYEGAPAAGKSSASAVDIEAGKRASMPCQACHGEVGVAPAPQWPTLAGQHESYLEQALKQYQTGQRNDAVMGAMAKPLDSATIAQLAAYFSSQTHLHGTEPR